MNSNGFQINAPWPVVHPRTMKIPPRSLLVSDPERSLTRRAKGGWGDLESYFLHNSNISSGSKGKKTWKILLFILAIAFVLRLFLVLYPEVIRNDGTEYIRHAKQVLLGNWAGGPAPPLYPLLIAIFHSLIPNIELAGIWVSLIFGTLIILPIFYLSKEIFNERIGIISALFATVHPYLYVSSGSVLTESTYYFLLTTAVLFGWRAFLKGHFYNLLLFSLFTTLAYLTRPEGIGFLFIFCIWVLLANPLHGRRHWAKRFGIILMAMLCFLVFASPYLIQIRKESGKWGISKKISISPGSLSDEGEIPSIHEMRKTREFPLISVVKHPLTALKKVGLGLLTSLYKFQQGLNPLLFFLALVGFISVLKRRSSFSLKGNFYLLSHPFFFFGFIFPFLLVIRRYTTQMVPLCLPWAAVGFFRVTEWVHQRWKWNRHGEKLVSFLLIVILIGLFIQGRILHHREFRLIQKEVGLWMKDHLPREGKIMSSLPQEAFYAELPWLHMPSKGYEEILKSARGQGVRYLTIDEKIEKDSPGFFSQLKSEDLAFVKDFKRENRSMAIFEVVYPKGQ